MLLMLPLVLVRVLFFYAADADAAAVFCYAVDAAAGDADVVAAGDAVVLLYLCC